MASSHSIAFTVGFSLALLSYAPSAAADPRECVDASELAQRLRDEGKLVGARRALLKCAAADCPPIISKDCTEWLVGVDARLPSVVLGAHDATGSDLTAVRVFVDGELLVSRLDGQSIPVDPGEHTFRFVFDNAPAVERRVVVNERDKARVLAVTVPPAARVEPIAPRQTDSPGSAIPKDGSRTVPIATYVLGGVGLLGFAGFTYFWLSAVGSAQDLRQTCAARACVDGDLSAARTQAIFADVSLGIGVAATISDAAFFVFRQKSAGPVAVGLVPSRSGLSVSAGTGF